MSTELEMNVATTTEIAPVHNYSSEYYRNPERDYAGYFNKYTADESSINCIKNEIKRLTELLAEQTASYSVILNKRYNADFSETTLENLFCYENRNSDSFYFDVNSGVPVIRDEENKNKYNIIKLRQKSGEVSVLVGYALSLGAVIIRRYKYTIPANNSRVNLTFCSELMLPVLDPTKSAYRNYPDGTISAAVAIGEEGRWNAYSDILSQYDANDFLSQFYGIDAKCCNVNLNEMVRGYITHPSMEMLVRQAPENSLKELLQINEEDKTPKKNLAQYLGLTKPELKTVIDSGLMNEWVNFIISYQSLERNNNQNWEKLKTTKTVPDWIDLMTKSKGWEEDFNFYHISYRDNSVFRQLLTAYVGAGYSYYNSNFQHFNKYYTFNEFCSYCVDGIINQGYTEVASFLNELKDYLNMAEQMHVAPHTDTSYLKQTHDIMSRNYKVQISEHQEEIFAERYAEYKPWVSKDKKFTLIAPKETNDVKEEGNMQNNCVGSYIKKVIDDMCRIYFFRSTEDVEHSLVTVEWRDGAMVQVKRSHNRSVTENDAKYLQECCEAKGWKYKG